MHVDEAEKETTTATVANMLQNESVLDLSSVRMFNLSLDKIPEGQTHDSSYQIKKKKLLQSNAVWRVQIWFHSLDPAGCVFTVAVYRLEVNLLTTTERSVTPCVSLSLSVLVCFQLREALPLPSHGFIPVVMVTRCSLTDLNTPNWGLYHDKMYRNASHTARGVCRQF